MQDKQRMPSICAPIRKRVSGKIAKFDRRQLLTQRRRPIFDIHIGQAMIGPESHLLPVVQNLMRSRPEPMRFGYRGDIAIQQVSCRGGPQLPANMTVFIAGVNYGGNCLSVVRPVTSEIWALG